MRNPRFTLHWTLALVAFALAASAGARPEADRWSVQVWNAAVLHSNSVYGIAQSQDGYLWLATPTHLVRFDGVRFETYAPGALGLPSSRRFRGLCLDKKGTTLWLALDDGAVVRLNADGSRVFSPAPDHAVEAMGCDRAGLWVLQVGEPVRHIVGDDVTSIPGSDGRGPRTLFCDRQDRVWLAGNRLLQIYRSGAFETVATLPGGAPVLAAAAEGGVWVGAQADILKADAHGTVHRVVTLPAGTANVSALYETDDDVLWIGTSNAGLMEYQDGAFSPVSASSRNVRSFFADAEGDLWVGTISGGLNRIRRKVVSVEGASSGLAEDLIASVCTDTAGQIWAVTQDGHLVQRTATGWQPVRPDEINGATCLAADPEGGIWIGTSRRRLFRLHGDALTVRGPETGFHTEIVALAATKTGDVWLVGRQHSVERLSGQTVRSYAIPVRSGAVRSSLLSPSRVIEDRDGQIWIGTEEGEVLRVENDRLVLVLPNNANLRRISSFWPAQRGGVWVGSYGHGLLWLQRDRVVGLRRKANGLTDDAVCTLAEDRHGDVWCVGVDRGLFKLGHAEIDAVLAGRATRVQSIHYGQDSSPPLAVTGVDPGGATIDGDGRLWLPTGPQLVIVDPNGARDVTVSSPIRIVRVDLDDQSWAIDRSVLPMRRGTQLLRLPLAGPAAIDGRHQKIAFQVACLTFSAPGNIRFRHRLSGFDTNWVENDAQGSEIAYPRLPPGRYRFEVQARNSVGRWSAAPATLDFDVVPAFWQRGWFEILSLGLFAFAVFWMARIISYRRVQVKIRILREQAALERERARIARDIHDDVGNRLTRIALLAGLAQQQREDPNRTKEHLTKISSSTAEVTKALDEIVWAVNPRNDTIGHLISYLARFAVEFCEPAGIRCEFDLPTAPPNEPARADVRHNVYLATKEAFNNIVRHAAATRMVFRVVLKGDRVEITIADNGRGFADAPQDATSDGLRNMAARLKDVGGRCDVTSRPGEGTRIVFSFRWRR